jgi:SAM-dependent methyltransferase
MSRWLALVAVFTIACREPSRTEQTVTPKVESPPGPTTSKTGAAFDKIYRSATWGTNDGGVGNSGTGSTLASTAAYRVVLQQFLADNNIHSVVDAGCGDWEFSKSIDWTGIDYKGIDIVPSVVALDKQRYEAPNIHFAVGNIVDDELPPADLLISKHVLQHLPLKDVKKFLDKLPKYKHVLITNGVDADTMSATNGKDIEPGDYRPLDITKPPFDVAGTKILTYWDGHHMHQVVHVAH